jgi:peptide deformylase
MDVEKCRITRFPAPVLGQVARPVDEINGDVRALADRMIDIMLDQKGIGLAAPQAGVDLRMFVVSVDGTRENAKVYINPEISVSGGLEGCEEGCLSLPGIFATIKRYKQCTVTATDLDGNRFTEEGRGMQIRAFQHEYDHLQGMLIKDRMGQVQRIAARKQLRNLREDYENGR